MCINRRDYTRICATVATCSGLCRGDARETRSGHLLSGRELFRSRGLPSKMANRYAVYQASKAPIRTKVTTGDARLS